MRWKQPATTRQNAGACFQSLDAPITAQSTYACPSRRLLALCGNRRVRFSDTFVHGYRVEFCRAYAAVETACPQSIASIWTSYPHGPVTGHKEMTGDSNTKRPVICLSPVKNDPISGHKEMTSNQITDLLDQMNRLATIARGGARQTTLSVGQRILQTF